MPAPAKDLRSKILNDNIWGLMFSMSLPAIIGMSINSINAFVDALFVGQLIGQDALAAISLAFPLTMITNGFTAMIGMGAASLLSRAIGSGDEEIQKKTFGTVTALSIITSLLLSVICIYFAENLIAFMGGTGRVLELGVEYYVILMIGAFFRMFAVAANMLIRAEGKIKESVILGISATLINMVLNPIFIGYFEMGIAGAAWATVVAMAIFTILQLWYFIRGKASFPVSLTTFSLERKMLRPILSVGVSAMMLQIMFFVQNAVVFKSLAHYGDDWDLAFMGACYRVVILMVLPIFGFAQALQPVLGINYGAGNLPRVKEAYIKFTTGSMAVMLTFLPFILFFPQTILGWMIPDTTFTPDDIFNYQIMMISLPLFPIFLMAATVFQSIGNAKAAFWLQVGREVIIYVPVLLILPMYYGVFGVYFAGIPVNILFTMVTLWMIFRQFRKFEIAK